MKQAWKLKSLVTTQAKFGLVEEDCLQWDVKMPIRPEKPMAASAMAQLCLRAQKIQ